MSFSFGIWSKFGYEVVEIIFKCLLSKVFECYEMKLLGDFSTLEFSSMQCKTNYQRWERNKKIRKKILHYSRFKRRYILVGRLGILFKTLHFSRCSIREICWWSGKRKCQSLGLLEKDQKVALPELIGIEFYYTYMMWLFYKEKIILKFSTKNRLRELWN